MTQKDKPYSTTYRHSGVTGEVVTALPANFEWEAVRPGMLVVEKDEPDLAPRTVESIRPYDESKFENDEGEMYVTFEGGGGQRRKATELAIVVGYSWAQSFHRNSFFAIEKPMTALSAMRALVDQGYADDADSIAFFVPRIQKEWNLLKSLMEGAGF
jgi:hypothetical protein